MTQLRIPKNAPFRKRRPKRLSNTFPIACSHDCFHLKILYKRNLPKLPLFSLRSCLVELLHHVPESTTCLELQHLKIRLQRAAAFQQQPANSGYHCYRQYPIPSLFQARIQNLPRILGGYHWTLHFHNEFAFLLSLSSSNLLCLPHRAARRMMDIHWYLMKKI